jgi:hypothetical protein
MIISRRLGFSRLGNKDGYRLQVTGCKLQVAGLACAHYTTGVFWGMEANGGDDLSRDGFGRNALINAALKLRSGGAAAGGFEEVTAVAQN